MNLSCHFRIFAFMGMVLACSIESQAQQEKLFFTGKTIYDGLSNNICESILRDSRGLLWIGTANGLNRFDGYHFDLFRNIPGDSTSLRENEIFVVHEDAEGNIWVGQDHSVSRLDKNGRTFTHFENDPTNPTSYSGGRAVDFFNDSEGRLWIGSTSGGLVLFDPKTNSFHPFYADPDHPMGFANRVIKIAEGRNGKLWLATHDGLYSFDPTNYQFRDYQYRPEETADKSYNNLSISVLADGTNDGLIWYGTWGSGIHSFNTHTGEIISYLFNSDGPKNLTNIVYAINRRDDHSLWLGTELGLALFDEGTHQFQLYTHEADNPHSLAGNAVLDLYTDDQHVLWIATGGGFNRLDPSLQKFKTKSLPQDFSVSQILRDSSSHTVYSVRYYDHRVLSIYDEDKEDLTIVPIPGADVFKSEPFGLFLDSRKVLWVGCVKTGLFRLNPDETTLVKVPTEPDLKIPDDKLNISSMVEDGTGMIWMASWSYGIIRYDPVQNHFSKMSPLEPDKFYGCFKVVCDKKHVIGLFENRGIQMFDVGSETPRIFRFANGGKYEDLRTMSDAVCDAPGRLWISTKTNGLALFEYDLPEIRQLTFFNTTKGFPDNNIGPMVFDNNHDLWIGSHDGFIFFDTRTHLSKLYDEEDGLYPFPAEFIPLNAHNGEIWFPSGDGYCAFNPSEFKQDNTNYPIVLNSVKVFDKEILPDIQVNELTQVDLKHDQNFLTTEFAALCLSDPGRIQYAYRLQGFEEEWHYCGTRRFASYTALKPGDYVLKIKATNSEGQWSPEMKSLRIIIHPAWWQTILFQVVFVLFLLALVFYVVRWFTRLKLAKMREVLIRQKEVQEIRNRIARDIHDEIGSGLTKISVMSSSLQEKTELATDTRKLGEKIQSTSRDVIESLGEIVWTVNPKNDSLGNLLSYIRQYSSKYFDHTVIQHQMTISWTSEEMKQTEVSPVIKRNLLMIVKESLNNIVKHSGASQCTIFFNVDARSIHVKIYDNGKGIKPANGIPDASHGNGLLNMQKRAEEMKSHLQIRSSDKGLEIEIDIPI